MKKVSIIVPVYNVEKYLRRCLDSLMNQTLSDIEVIVVNDASPDRSADIMREYEEKYPDRMICVFLHKNVKQGGARNVGIRKSTGEYIMFVDSDDWVDTTICEKMYQAAKQEDSDIVFCDVVRVFEDSGKEKYIMETGKEIEGDLTLEKKKELLTMKAYPFAKLLRKDIITANELFFAEGIQYEDQINVPFFFLYAKHASKLNDFLYYYNIRENSTMFTMNSTHHFQRMETTKMFYDQSIQRGFYAEFSEELEMFFIRSYYFFMLDSCLERFDEPPLDKMQEISKKLRELCPDYQNNYYIDKIVDPIYLQMAKYNDQSPKQLIDKVEALRKCHYSYLGFYQLFKVRAQQLLTHCEQNSFRIAVWGAGQKGKDFLEVNDSDHHIIRYVIDGNVNREGELLPTGHRISAYDHVMEDIDIILVINKNYFGDIYHRVAVSNKNIKVINLDLYLIYRIGLEAFLK